MIYYMTSSLLSKRTRKWSVEVGVVLTAVNLHLLVNVRNHRKDANDTFSKSKKDSPPRRPDRSGSNRPHLMIKMLNICFKYSNILINNSKSAGFNIKWNLGALRGLLDVVV